MPQFSAIIRINAPYEEKRIAFNIASVSFFFLNSFDFFLKSFFICFLYLYLWRQPIIKIKVETINAMKRKIFLSPYQCRVSMKSMLNYFDFVLTESPLTEL